jgi:hypothetical protein
MSLLGRLVPQRSGLDPPGLSAAIVLSRHKLNRAGYLDASACSALPREAEPSPT